MWKKWYINQVFINWEWGWECWNQNYSNVYLKIWRRDSELKWWALLRFGNHRWLGIRTLILGPIKLSYSIFYIAKLPFIKYIYIFFIYILPNCKSITLTHMNPAPQIEPKDRTGQNLSLVGSTVAFVVDWIAS